jgi:hypothetical protein
MPLIFGKIIASSLSRISNSEIFTNWLSVFIFQTEVSYIYFSRRNVLRTKNVPCPLREKLAFYLENNLEAMTAKKLWNNRENKIVLMAIAKVDVVHPGKSGRRSINDT